MTGSNTLQSYKDMAGRKFLFLNVRSIVPNINILRHEFEHSNISVLGFCETWLTPRIPNNLVKIQGYNMERADRKGKKRGGGLIMYIHDQLHYDTLPEDHSFSDENIEMLSLIIKPACQTNFIVSIVYIPPSADKKIATDRIKQLCLPGNKSVIRILAGDFNMEYSKKKDRQKDYHLLQSIERSLSLSQIISKPTRETATTSSLIDLIFISSSVIDNVSLIAVFNYNVSDHNIICFCYKKEPIKNTPISFRFRKKSNYNLAVLLHKLTTYDWSAFYRTIDPTDCWILLYNAYLSILNEVAPYITKTNVPSRAEWIDDNAIQMMKIRDDLRNKMNYTDDPEVHKNFSVARNKARQAVNNARSKFVQEGLVEHRHSPKKYWEKLKELMPGKKDQSRDCNDIHITDDRGVDLGSNLDMANHANRYFVQVGPNLATLININNRPYLDKLPEFLSCNVSLSSFPLVQEQELTRTCKEININKASNITDIQSRYFKDCMLCTIPQITYLFGLVFKTKTIPNS